MNKLFSALLSLAVCACPITISNTALADDGALEINNVEFSIHAPISVEKIDQALHGEFTKPSFENILNGKYQIILGEPKNNVNNPDEKAYYFEIIPENGTGGYAFIGHDFILDSDQTPMIAFYKLYMRESDKDAPIQLKSSDDLDFQHQYQVTRLTDGVYQNKPIHLIEFSQASWVTNPCHEILFVDAKGKLNQKKLDACKKTPVHMSIIRNIFAINDDNSVLTSTVLDSKSQKCADSSCYDQLNEKTKNLIRPKSIKLTHKITCKEINGTKEKPFQRFDCSKK